MKILFPFLFVFLIGFSNSEKAPNFTMQSPDGEMIDFSQFEGEVIYLSFWASWCGVCKRNFYKYKDVRQKLEEKGVLLINVSIDKNQEDWIDAMNKTKIPGLHFLAKDIETVQDLYKLSSVPGYEIVNRQGELVYLSQEENRDIFADFDRWLEEPKLEK